MNYEESVMHLIVNGGNGRSKAMEAIRSAKQGRIDEAKVLYQQACDFISNAHEAQTALIQSEAGGKKTEISMLLIHAQDHLMNAMTVRDMAREFIDLYEMLRTEK